MEARASLACQSRRPQSHPNQHTEAELKPIRDMRHNPVLSANFLKKLVKWYARRCIKVEYAQANNGFEFTNRFSNSKRDLPTLFETTDAQLGVHHKLIYPYTPRHNSKASAALVKGCGRLFIDRSENEHNHQRSWWLSLCGHSPLFLADACNA